MHSPSPLVKAAALSGFVLLMTGFVAYRSGYLDKYLFSPNGGNSLSTMEQPGTFPADTSKKPGDSITISPMMSSSKSIIIADQTTTTPRIRPDLGKPRVYIADSVLKKYQVDKDIEKVLMTSSKSGMVIPPHHPGRTRYPVSINGVEKLLTVPQIDSLFLLQPVMDSVRITPDTVTKEPVRFYGTKSGPVIRSTDIKQKKKNKKKDNNP